MDIAASYKCRFKTPKNAMPNNDHLKPRHIPISIVQLETFSV